jgi:hypothetical protein
MAKLCGSCKFWKPGECAAPGYGQCGKIEHDESSHTSTTIYDEEYLVELASGDEDDKARAAEVRKAREQKAVALDGSGYFAAVRCREDFGCVLHENK